MLRIGLNDEGLFDGSRIDEPRSIVRAKELVVKARVESGSQYISPVSS